MSFCSCKITKRFTQSLQTTYKKDVLSFVEVVQNLGNPFDYGDERVTLDTQEVMGPEVTTSLMQIQDLGKQIFFCKFIQNMCHRCLKMQIAQFLV